jgi:hypothetical protein
MSDDITGTDPLERELRALGRSLAISPPAPTLSADVLARLAGDVVEAPRVGAGSRRAADQEATPRSARPAAFGWPRRRIAAAVAATALLVVVLVPPVRAAVLGFFRIGGVTVEKVPSPPPSSTPAPPATPLTGARSGVVTSLAEAEARVGIDVSVPLALGPPTTVAVAHEDRVVEVTWDRSGGPVRLDVFAGSLSWGYVKRVWGSVTPTHVAGRDAVWFGASHEIEWVDRTGHTRSTPPRVAGPTLVWVERTPDGRELTYRLEGPATLAAATAIAETTP